MRYAIIDIGTNTIRMMIADKALSGFNVFSKELLLVRLGEGILDGMITDAATKRAIDALLKFRDKAQSLNADKIICFGTSAVRDAKNKKGFLQTVFNETGLNIEIISGAAEAKLGFLGAVGKNGTGGIIDIGGGSTEIIFGENGVLNYSKSFQAGVVRWLYKYPDADKIGKSVYDECAEMAHEFFSELNLLTPVLPVYGISGTATTLCTMKLKIADYDASKVHGLCLKLDEIEEMADLLTSTTIEQRYNIVGLEKSRADIIPFGAIILISVMHSLNLNEIVVSDSDNLEGYLIKNYS
ncbi:MAG: hypothetical protein R2876_07305 [Eubacteriales bacterium]